MQMDDWTDPMNTIITTFNDKSDLSLLVELLESLPKCVTDYRLDVFLF